MNLNDILSKCDHTLLTQTATWEEIKAICDDGMKYHTASVCIPASFVKQAKEYVGDRLVICTVIGFPNGYATTPVKCFETVDAVNNGADEIDMVINIGWVKDRRYDEVLNEIKAVRAAVEANDVEAAQAAANKAGRLLDKAASKGIIHKNQAAQRKSGAQKLVNSIK